MYMLANFFYIGFICVFLVYSIVYSLEFILLPTILCLHELLFIYMNLDMKLHLYILYLDES